VNIFKTPLLLVGYGVMGLPVKSGADWEASGSFAVVGADSCQVLSFHLFFGGIPSLAGDATSD
jgi:hypothetical protein